MKKHFALLLLLTLSVSFLMFASAEKYTSGNYRYTLNTNGSATITAYTGPEEAVTVPNKLDGHTVTSIGESAFARCDWIQSVKLPNSINDIGFQAFYDCSLTSITLPDNLRYIGTMAFSSCDSLASITLPDSLQSIEDAVFFGCVSLESIILPASLTYIGSVPFYLCSSLTSIQVKIENPVFASREGILFNQEDKTLVAYPQGKSATEYSIPQGITAIADGAFSYNPWLTTISLPNSLQSIGQKAFVSCTSLTSIRLPENVESIGGGAFASCDSLSSIWVVPNNSVFTSNNGVLYNKQDMTLVAYPAGQTVTEYSVPQGITIIAEEAFNDVQSLISINFPDTLQSIGRGAFLNCKSLTSVSLPDSLQTIGSDAFYNCENVTLIVFKDSYAQQYAEENGIPYQFSDSIAYSQNVITEGPSTDVVAYSQVDFRGVLQQSSWQYTRSETRSDTVEGPSRMTNADYANENIITLTFEKGGNMVARYTPRTGGDSAVFEYSYTIDNNSRALIQNDDFEFKGKTYASFVEYTLNVNRELVSRMMMVDKATYLSYYYGDTNIYSPVTLR